MIGSKRRQKEVQKRPDAARLPTSAVTSAGPKRRRRKLRGVHRIRFGLVLGAVATIGIGFFALPVANDIRDSTVEFLIPGDQGLANPGSDTLIGPFAATAEKAPEPVLDFDTSVFVDPRMVNISPPQGVDGLLTFRGSPTRSFYGRGPVPAEPEVQWRFPESGGLCRSSTVGGVTRGWCGLGWTGQPSLFKLDGRFWTIFGALDGGVHFLDAETGDPLLPSFQTEDIIKGSVTVDPDGFPLVYTGSRDNIYRIISFDQGEPIELWGLDSESVGPRLWNNDWDGAGLVLDDWLLIGGENSRIHIVKLNRSFDENGFVTVDPELFFDAPGWDDELLAVAGDNVSIENSVAVSGDTMYFANSGGLVQGWDLAPLRNEEPPERVFRYWVGDDVDASIVIDEEGMLYVASEFERGNARARELGQLIKLDPSEEGEDALVWSVQENQGLDTGIWGTPALHDGAIIFGSQGGQFRAVDRETGEDLWSIDGLGFHLWQSPVVVDDVLIMGDCFGTLRGYDVTDVTIEPPELWALRLDEACIESTPAVWDGTIVVGTRSGGVYGIR